MLPRVLIPRSEAVDGGARARAILGAPGAVGSDVALEEMLLVTTMPRRKPLDLLVSVGLHSAFIVVLLIAPMFLTRQMVLARNEVTMLAPTLPYAPPPPLGGARAAVQKA